MTLESYYIMVFATIGVAVTALWIGIEISDRRARRKKTGHTTASPSSVPPTT